MVHRQSASIGNMIAWLVDIDAMLQAKMSDFELVFHLTSSVELGGAQWSCYPCIWGIPSDKTLQPRLQGKGCCGSCRTCGQKSFRQAPHTGAMCHGLKLQIPGGSVASYGTESPQWRALGRPKWTVGQMFGHLCGGRHIRWVIASKQNVPMSKSNIMFLTMLAWNQSEDLWILLIGECWPEPWTQLGRRGSHHSQHRVPLKTMSHQVMR